MWGLWLSSLHACHAQTWRIQGGDFDCPVCTPATPKFEDSKVQTLTHRLFVKHCACHRSKNSVGFFSEHLRPPHVHLKESRGCFSNTAPATGSVQTAWVASRTLPLPQVQKRCRSFLWTLAPTTRPFQRVHRLLLKTAPATGPKTVKRFLVNTCAYHTSILKSARAASQTLRRPQVQKHCKGFLWTLAPTTRPFQRVHRLLLKTAPATGPKTVQGFLVNTCAYHTSILKECTGCFSKLHLPQRQKQCRGFLWTLAPTTRPFQRVHGLLFNTAPATGPKTVKRFLVNTCAYHTSILKSARVAFQNCACHRCKNSAGVSCEHLRLPHVHFKECRGCFSKLRLPQVQKQCRGFLWTLAPTTRPFQRVHGLLFKTAPATGPKTVQGFLANTCAHQTSISKSARVAFQNCACHRSKNRGFLWTLWRLPRVHFKECTENARVASQNCACHRFKNSARVLLKICAYHTSI